MDNRPGYSKVTFPLAALLIAGSIFGPLLLAQSQPATPALVIDGATLIDGTGKSPVAGVAILIEGKRIRQIGPSGSLKVPAGAQTIQARGKFVIPGLIDLHVHYNAPWLHKLYLANGVTTVRDLGSAPDKILTLRQEIAAGNILAPRLFVSGMPINPRSIKAGGYSSAKEMALKQAEAGVDGIKANGYTVDELKGIVEAAHSKGLTVYGHTGPKFNNEGPGTLAAVEAGIDGVEHVLQLLEDSLDKPVPVPADFDGSRSDQLYRYYYGRLHRVVDFKKLDHLIQRMVEKNVFLDPTIVTHERNFAFRNTPEILANPALRYMTEDRPDRLGHYEAEDREEWKKVSTLMKQTTYKFHKAGGMLVLGTDSQAASPDGALPGWSMHEELQNFVSSGITPMEVIQIATRNNARALRQEKDLGTVEVGKYADLVILDANPLADIRNTQKIYRVVREGLVLDPRVLLEQHLQQFGEKKRK